MYYSNALSENKVFNANEFVQFILKEIPFFEIIPLPSNVSSQVVFNLKTRDLNEASRVFYKNGISFTTVVDEDNETYLEAYINVEFVPLG